MPRRTEDPFEGRLRTSRGGGALVPRATVTGVNVATGIRTSAATTEAGNYDIPLLPVGIYRVEIGA